MHVNIIIKGFHNFLVVKKFIQAEYDLETYNLLCS